MGESTEAVEKGKARKQQFVRLRPHQEAILERLRQKYTTPISEPDFSTLIRHCVEFKGPWIDQDPVALLREAAECIEDLKMGADSDWRATLQKIKHALGDR